MTTTLFDIAAENLEECTDLDRLAVRGTLRIALKEAGLDLRSLTVPQLRTVFEKLMPYELKSRGVADAAAVCRAVMDQLADTASAANMAAPSSPDEIFDRLIEN
jgi:hypothetical protein